MLRSENKSPNFGNRINELLHPTDEPALCGTRRIEPRTASRIENMNTGSILTAASQQWATRPADQRFETLEALRASVNARRLRSRSLDLDLPRIKVEARGDDIVVNSAIAPSAPSHWAFSQFAGLLKAPANYLRNLPVDLTVKCLNAGIEAAPRDSVKFMTVTNEDGPNTLQAVTSPTYGRIWDADVVDAVTRVVERTGGRFYNPKAIDLLGGGAPKPSGLYASDRDVFCFMIDGGSDLDVGPRAQLNRGFFVSNSEVGARTFTLTKFLFNRCCGNHIVWGAQDVETLSIRHTKGGPYRFDSEATPALLEYVNRSAAVEETVIRTAIGRSLPRGDDNRVSIESLEKLVAPAKITRAELRSAIDFAKSEEGKCDSLWDLVQGLTAYARGFDFVDARVDLETRAGKLLNLAQ